jgi:perosamine synthetase
MTPSTHLHPAAESALGSARRALPRKQAILGGTTSWGDAAVALQRIARPRRLIDGPAIGQYERAFADRIGTRYAISFSSGRVGLYGTLLALGVGHGDEVLLQTPTHVVVPNAVRYTGADPVYVDCSLDNYNMDLDGAERLISARTKALVLQHTFGIPADLDSARELCVRHRIHLIEDCVHALGAGYNGRPVGSFGHAAFFSTEETKTISTTMGGMVTTDDELLAEGLRSFHQRCAPPSSSLTVRRLLKLVVYHLAAQPHVHAGARTIYESIGRPQPLPSATTEAEALGRRPEAYEERLSDAQAELGLRQLLRLDANLAHRRRIADIYGAGLAEAGVRQPLAPAGAEAVYLRYPVCVSDRPQALIALSRYAVLGQWFTSVLEEAVSPSHVGYQPGSCPRAELASRHLVNLPTHQRVTETDAEVIARAISACA